MSLCPFGRSSRPPAEKRSSTASRRPSNVLFQNYSDKTPFHVLKLPPAAGTEPYNEVELQELYGRAFIEELEREPKRIDLLRNIAFNLHDLLNSLESLHFHLFADENPVFRFPQGMRCEKRKSDGALLFHFSSSPNSWFTDPRNMVAGIVNELCMLVFKMKVSVEMELEEWGGRMGDIRHCVFAIHEVVREGQSPVGHLLPIDSLASYYFPQEMFISPRTLCKACPFHVIFDHDLNLVEIGSLLQKVLKIPVKEDGSVVTVLNFTHTFDLKRPTLDELSFDAFLVHLNSVVELQVKESAAVAVSHRNRKKSSRARSRAATEQEGDCNPPRRACIIIRGQVFHVPESGSLLFLGSPPVRTLTELEECGLYISDIPVHDATRDLILQNGAYQGNTTLENQLIQTGKDIEDAQHSLQEKQENSGKLLRSMLPNPVVDSLLHGENIKPKLFQSVTIMFSDLTNFSELTADWQPRQIVDLLNHLYTEFDEILPCHNVYKVETVNDSYVVVGGCPEPDEHHAREVAMMGIDMMDTMDSIDHPVTGGPLTDQLRIGIHSGSIQAGVVGTERPRYCLFGDTVNVTSRTLTSGSPGTITITEYTYEKLKKYAEFCLVHPRPVPMKGVDEPVTCYTLSKNRRSVSVDSMRSTRKTSKPVTFEWEAYRPVAPGLSLDRKYLGGRSMSEGAVGNMHPFTLTSCNEVPPSPLVRATQRQRKGDSKVTNKQSLASSKHSIITSKQSLIFSKQSHVYPNRHSKESSTSRSISVHCSPDGFLLTQPTSSSGSSANSPKRVTTRARKRTVIRDSIVEESVETTVSSDQPVARFLHDEDGTDIDEVLLQNGERMEETSNTVIQQVTETDV